MTRTLSSVLVLLMVGGVSWAQGRPQSEDAEVHAAPARPCLEARCNLPTLSKRELKRLMVSPEDLRRKAVRRFVAGGVLLGLGTLLTGGAVAMVVAAVRADHIDGSWNPLGLYAALLGIPGVALSATGAGLLVSGLRARDRADELERVRAPAPGRRVTVGWSFSF